MSQNPYVSFALYGRNDQYTPNYLQRINRATLHLARQLEQAGVASEIVFTEWNPLPGRPLILDSLTLPERLTHVTIRGFIVPEEQHRRITAGGHRGIPGGEASNVSIRRARGLFVTPKASDSFLSPEVVSMIARQNLHTYTMYRIDRHDVVVPDEHIWDLDDDALLDALKSLPSTRSALIIQKPYWNIRDLHTNACGDFILMARNHWNLVRGHPSDTTALALDLDSLVMHAAAASGVRECRWPEPCRLYKPRHEGMSSLRVEQTWQPWQWRLDRFLATHVSEIIAHRIRMLLDYPRRSVRGRETLGPSIERHFVGPASRWKRGAKFVPNQPEDWGLAKVPLEQRQLCLAAWDRPASEGARDSAFT